MKKTLLVLLLIASLITTAFAAKGPEVMLGVSSGFNEEVKFHENIDPTTRDIVPIKADALFYLGDSLAFNTALGMDIYIPNNEYRDPSVGFVADILAYYRKTVQQISNETTLSDPTQISIVAGIMLCDELYKEKTLLNKYKKSQNAQELNDDVEQVTKKLISALDKALY